MSAGPVLPPESVMVRGDGRLKAAAEMVRVPGGNGVAGRGEEDLFIGPVVPGTLPSVA